MDLWPLCKLTHCEGENVVSDLYYTMYIIIQDNLTPKITSKFRLSLILSNWNESALDFIGRFVFFKLFPMSSFFPSPYGSPFIHDG